MNVAPPAYMPYSHDGSALPPLTVTAQLQSQSMIAIQPRQTSASRSYWKALWITGYMQVALGVISVFFGVVAIVFKPFMYLLGNPIWSGMCFYIIAGVVGIASGRKQAKGLVVTYMVLCILAASVSCGVSIAHAVAIVVGGFHGCPDAHHHPLFEENSVQVQDFIYRVGCSSSVGSRIAINSLISVVGFAEMIVAIVASCFTCCTVCKSTTPTQLTVVQYAAPQQYVQLPQYVEAMFPEQRMAIAPPQPQYGPQGQALLQPNPHGQGQAPPPEKSPPPIDI